MPPVPADPQTITVIFTLQGSTPTFTFDPNPLTLPNTGGSSPTSYTVTFHLDTAVSGAVFKAEHQDAPHPPPHLTVISGDETADLTIGFDNEGLTAPDHFGYKVTVRANGQLHTSQDPELVIPPPT